MRLTHARGQMLPGPFVVSPYVVGATKGGAKIDAARRGSFRAPAQALVASIPAPAHFLITPGAACRSFHNGSCGLTRSRRATWSGGHPSSARADGDPSMLQRITHGDSLLDPLDRPATDLPGAETADRPTNVRRRASWWLGRVVAPLAAALILSEVALVLAPAMVRDHRSPAPISAQPSSVDPSLSSTAPDDASWRQFTKVTLRLGDSVERDVELWIDPITRQPVAVVESASQAAPRRRFYLLHECSDPAHLELARRQATEVR